MMFEDWLVTTRDLQEKSFGKDPAQLTNIELVQYLRWNQLAVIDELMEALHEIYWKPWTTDEPGFRNRDAFVGELVDALHFIGNMLVAANCSDEELSLKYAAKQQKNRDRMASGGYRQDKDKCHGCGAAFDDAATRCLPNDWRAGENAWCANARPEVERDDDEWEDAELGTNVNVGDAVRVKPDAYVGRAESLNGTVLRVATIHHGKLELRHDDGQFTLHTPDKLQVKKPTQE